METQTRVNLSSGSRHISSVKNVVHDVTVQKCFFLVLDNVQGGTYRNMCEYHGFCGVVNN